MADETTELGPAITSTQSTCQTICTPGGVTCHLVHKVTHKIASDLGSLCMSIRPQKFYCVEVLALTISR